METLSPHQEEALVSHLLQFVTPAKRQRMREVIARRTSYVQVVLEDIYQPHNASAVMRSCECFGIQHLHVIENRYTYTLNREVAMGSSKWITLHRYREEGGDNTGACVSGLRNRGFRIAATSLEEGAIPLDELPLDRRTALCFGTEEEGLSRALLDQADVHVRIPMHGFTQSFNISVSAAICLYELRRRLEFIDGWQLDDAERRAVYRLWLRSAVRNSEVLERTFLGRESSR